MISPCVALPEVLSPGEAVMLRNSLLSALKGSEKIIINASALHELSVQGVMVLLSFIASASKSNHPWALKAPSEEFIAALEHYGLFPQLMTWPIEA